MPQLGRHLETRSPVSLAAARAASGVNAAAPPASKMKNSRRRMRNLFPPPRAGEVASQRVRPEVAGPMTSSASRRGRLSVACVSSESIVGNGSDDDVDLEPNEVRDQRRKTIVISFRIAVLEHNVFPSIHPRSRSPFRNAWFQGAASERVKGDSSPICRTFAICATAASGQLMVEPAIPLIKSRRRIAPRSLRSRAYGPA